MKILWFTNSPCGSIKRNPTSAVKSGGWLISLEEEIKKEKDIQLEVAFFSDKKERPFVFDGVKYYPMYRNIFDTSKGVNRIRERLVPQYKKDAKVLPLMLDVVNRSKPDIIHIHGTEEAFGLIAEHIKDIPIVFSIQGLLAPYSEKYFSGMPYSSVLKYESIYDKLRNVSVKNEFELFYYKAKRELSYLKSANYILGRTFWDRYITEAINPNCKYFVVNEILREPFYLKKWNKECFSRDKLKIISIISGGIYKGFETVLRTANILKNYSKLDYEWFIVGYDEKTKWVKIASQITKLDYKKLNIRLLGRIDADKLSDYLINTDIYCHVSHIENSPNSVCEAMIIGMPVIASFAGGTASLVENGNNGILVQDGDPFVYAGAICNLYHNFELAKLYGQKARIDALNRHNKDRIKNELITAYHAILCDFQKKYCLSNTNVNITE